MCWFTPASPSTFKKEERMLNLTLDDIQIHDLGNTIQISGIIMSGDEIDYCCFLPDYVENLHNISYLDMNLEDWKKFFHQTDTLETEIFTNENGQLTKTIVRKCERQIDQFISWKVFHRDNYSCRYCGRTEIPLTVDHLILWEDGGPSIEENLLSACRKCNKTRGRMKYEDWLNSNYYKEISQKLPNDIVRKNEYLASTLSSIPVRINKKSR